MNKYLEYLAKQAGLHTSTSGDDGDGGWESLEAEKDGRPLPALAVWWETDWNAWIASVGTLASGEFAHPSDAFQWLRNAVAAYVWPVCVHCNDTGVDGSDFCDHCWHGQQAEAKETVDRR